VAQDGVAESSDLRVDCGLRRRRALTTRADFFAGFFFFGMIVG